MARQALDFLRIRADERVFGNLPFAGVFADRQSAGYRNRRMHRQTIGPSRPGLRNADEHNRHVTNLIVDHLATDEGLQGTRLLCITHPQSEDVVFLVKSFIVGHG